MRYSLKTVFLLVSSKNYMTRFIHIFISFVIFLSITTPSFAQSSSNTSTQTAASKPVTVVVSIQIRPGISRSAVTKVTQPIISAIQKQPGLIQSEFFENINHTLKPDFVHVTRWKSFKEWENMIVNGTLDKLLEPIKPLCTTELRAYTLIQ